MALKEMFSFHLLTIVDKLKTGFFMLRVSKFRLHLLDPSDLTGTFTGKKHWLSKPGNSRNGPHNILYNLNLIINLILSSQNSKIQPREDILDLAISFSNKGIFRYTIIIRK